MYQHPKIPKPEQNSFIKNCPGWFNIQGSTNFATDGK
jgi:hypothetical protein